MASSTTEPAPPADGASVLVSGAGFAGLASAWWLSRLGHRVTVVEQAAALRRGGTPVDIEGETIEILARMGLAEAVIAKALPPRALAFKDADGRTLATLGGSGGEPGSETGRGGEGGRGDAPRYEIHRDDLLDVLSNAVAGRAEIRFGRTVTRLEDEGGRVAVMFDNGERRDFAMVLGCDGARSNTRRMLFGGGDDFTYFMGGYVYLKVIPSVGLLAADTTEVFNAPGRMAMLNGYQDRTDIGLGFRTEGEIPYDHRDRPAQRRLIRERFEDLGWKVPAMLESVDGADDFYFDRIAQVRAPTWSRGRVALVGDAGYCVSPLAGFGGSMAIIGAGRLGQALEEHPGDLAEAFRAYEEGLRPFVAEVQERAATRAMALIFPRDEAELEQRNRRLAEGHIDI